MDRIVVALSFLFQAAATIFFLRLLKITKRHPAVILLAATSIIMLYRRLRILIYLISGNPLNSFGELNEIMGLAASIFLLGAAFWIVPELLQLARTGKDLQEKHSAASQMIRDLAIPAFVIDKTHTVTHWNKACENLTGVKYDKIVGTREPWRAFYLEPRPLLADLILDGASEKEIKKLYGEACSRSETVKGGFEAEFFLPAINGGRWMFFTASPLRDPEGDVYGVIETFQDTSGQKKAGIHLSRSASRLRTLHEIVKEIAFENDIISLMTKTVRLLDEKLSITNVSILENKSRDMGDNFSPLIIASSSIDASEYGDFSLRLHESGKGLSMKAAREKHIIITPDISVSPDFFPFLKNSVSELDIPILDGEKILGVIAVEGYAPFDASDGELFTILAGHLASLWRYLDMVKAMGSLALTDQLTGIPNRRALFERLKEEGSRLERYGTVLSLIMIDMAHFKEINDTYGHLTGDSALKAVARLIQGCLRSCDFSARFGGDEFVVLLPETGSREAVPIIERIASGLSGIQIKGLPLNLSADFGLASFPEDGQILDAVLRIADDRMYGNKKSRNLP